MNFDPDVLGTSIIDRVLQDLDARLVVLVERNRSYRYLKALQEFSQPEASFVASLRAMYSASAVEAAMELCLVAFH